MMRGWWRPFVSVGALVIAILLPLQILGRARGDPLLGLLGVLLATLPFPGLFVLQARSRVRGFLRGLAEGGERAVIVSDEMTWLAEWSVVARSDRGEWRFRSTGGKYAHLDARAPEMRVLARVWGSARKAGRDAAAAHAAGRPWSPTVPQSWLGRHLHVTPAYRPRLALALIAGSFAAAVLVGIVAPPHGLVLLVGLAAALGWFVAVVGGATLAAVKERGSFFVLGAGAGAAFLGSVYAAVFVMHHASPSVPILAAVCGALAASLAWLGRDSRVAGSVAALLVGGGAWFLPQFYLGLTIALAVLSLLVLWRPRTAKRAASVRS